MTYAVIGIMTGQHLNMTRNQSSKSFLHLMRLEKTVYLGLLWI